MKTTPETTLISDSAALSNEAFAEKSKEFLQNLSVPIHINSPFRDLLTHHLMLRKILSEEPLTKRAGKYSNIKNKNDAKKEISKTEYELLIIIKMEHDKLENYLKSKNINIISDVISKEFKELDIKKSNSEAIIAIANKYIDRHTILKELLETYIIDSFKQANDWHKTLPLQFRMKFQKLKRHINQTCNTKLKTELTLKSTNNIEAMKESLDTLLTLRSKLEAEYENFRINASNKKTEKLKQEKASKQIKEKKEFHTLSKSMTLTSNPDSMEHENLLNEYNEQLQKLSKKLKSKQLDECLNSLLKMHDIELKISQFSENNIAEILAKYSSFVQKNLNAVKRDISISIQTYICELLNFKERKSVKIKIKSCIKIMEAIKEYTYFYLNEFHIPKIRNTDFYKINNKIENIYDKLSRSGNIQSIISIFTDLEGLKIITEQAKKNYLDDYKETLALIKLIINQQADIVSTYKFITENIPYKIKKEILDDDFYSAVKEIKSVFKLVSIYLTFPENLTLEDAMGVLAINYNALNLSTLTAEQALESIDKLISAKFTLFKIKQTAEIKMRQKSRSQLESHINKAKKLIKDPDLSHENKLAITAAIDLFTTDHPASDNKPLSKASLDVAHIENDDEIKSFEKSLKNAEKETNKRRHQREKSEKLTQRKKSEASKRNKSKKHNFSLFSKDTKKKKKYKKIDNTTEENINPKPNTQFTPQTEFSDEALFTQTAINRTVVVKSHQPRTTEAQKHIKLTTTKAANTSKNTTRPIQRVKSKREVKLNTVKSQKIAPPQSDNKNNNIAKTPKITAPKDKAKTSKSTRKHKKYKKQDVQTDKVKPKLKTNRLALQLQSLDQITSNHSKLDAKFSKEYLTPLVLDIINYHNNTLQPFLKKHTDNLSSHLSNNKRNMTLLKNLMLTPFSKPDDLNYAISQLKTYSTLENHPPFYINTIKNYLTEAQGILKLFDDNLNELQTSLSNNSNVFSKLSNWLHRKILNTKNWIRKNLLGKEPCFMTHIDFVRNSQQTFHSLDLSFTISEGASTHKQALSLKDGATLSETKSGTAGFTTTTIDFNNKEEARLWGQNQSPPKKGYHRTLFQSTPKHEVLPENIDQGKNLTSHELDSDVSFTLA